MTEYPASYEALERQSQIIGLWSENMPSRILPPVKVLHGVVVKEDTAPSVSSAVHLIDYDSEQLVQVHGGGESLRNVAEDGETKSSCSSMSMALSIRSPAIFSSSLTLFFQVLVGRLWHKALPPSQWPRVLLHTVV
jgi:hypothetical protein